MRFRAVAVSLAAGFAAAGACLAGCASEGEAPLAVGAAASLREPIEEIARRYEAANPPVRVQPVFGATSELAAQLRAGAPLDLLLSADEAIAQQLATEGLLAALTPFASNRLVVIAREEIAAQIARPADLTGAAVQRVAMPSSAVPIGHYAREWLGRLGLADAVEARGVRTEHVRATLAAVESGHADAAVVYATDARLAHSARVAFEIPDAEQPRIAYVAGIARASRQPERTESFLAFLAGAEAVGILRDAGFAPAAGVPRS